MTTFNSFEEIEAWKLARRLTKEVYSASTNTSDFSKDFGLKDQIRRASVSIMSNISEGFERGGSKEFMQFLAIAKGSTGEVKSQLYIASDLDYIDESLFYKLSGICDEISNMLGGLISYLNKTDFKGIKYK